MGRKHSAARRSRVNKRERGDEGNYEQQTLVTHPERKGIAIFATTASVLRAKIVHLWWAPTSPRGHIAVCTVCFLACPRIRNENPETPEQLRFRRFRQTPDPRVSCCAGHRSTVQISGPPCIVRL